MRTNIDVERDLKSAPYTDAFGQKILPGQIVAVMEGEPFAGVMRIKDGEFMFNETPLDAILEETDNLVIIGWVQ